MLMLPEQKQLVQDIVNDPIFRLEVRSILASLSQQTQIDLPFEHYSRPPPSATVDTAEVIKSVSDTLCELMDSNMRVILNKEFSSLYDELLQLRECREEVLNFAKEHAKRSEEFQAEVSKQMEGLKRKMAVQSAMQPSQRGISRQRNTIETVSGLAKSRQTGGKQSRSALYEINELKVEMEKMRSESKESKLGKDLSEKMVYIEEKLSQEIMELKMSMEMMKQRQNGLMEAVQRQLEASSSKEQIAKEVKRVVKAGNNVLIDEIQKAKVRSAQLEESMDKIDKNLQDYFSNQLKSLWVLVSNIKRRIQEIEEATNMQNQSFVMD